ncbi:hypothetical protein DL89DRAFT_254072 [Linderina pennispora]|uniref:Uncharacterized protein n=1 Tax=Linderina pennispora TaxID=61395 RepID=A0A1Y1WKW7_9FUNG|nr:uncharacterized protein DL89DRAFT_254072 [Linderina pennispora]ORX74197.1 hypothetical protein DL89DRAFT_254072 [Linderina pennispora]
MLAYILHGVLKQCVSDTSSLPSLPDANLFREVAYQMAQAGAVTDRLRVEKLQSAMSVGELSEKLRVAQDRMAEIQNALEIERQERAVASDTIEDMDRRLRSLRAAYDDLCHQCLRQQQKHTAASRTPHRPPLAEDVYPMQNNSYEVGDLIV